MTIAPRLRIAAACLLFAGAASALDYPPRKPGLWEMSIQSEDGASKAPAMQTQQCIDAATDKAMRDMGSSTGQQACSKQDMRTEGGRIVVDSVCKIGATTATTHAVVSGDIEHRLPHGKPLQLQPAARRPQGGHGHHREPSGSGPARPARSRATW